jgi:NodT family efflux transporter outer membrane factor (OMF) lipoprotein
VAVTLSPVMSAYFVHPPGHEGRLTALVNRGFDVVRDRYARLLDGALGIRWAIVAASFIVLAAAWPLYQFSRRELAPIEDQSHITMFMEASPDASLAASNRASLEVVRRITAFPEAEFMWSLTAPWGGFGGLVAKDWKERERSTEEMYGEVYGAVSTVPGLRVFPRLDPPLPTPGQYDVELVLQSDAPPEQMLETVGAVVGAGWQSGKFLYVDTDLKIDLPEARVVIDRERVADLGLDLASVGQELGTLLGGGYVNRFNFFDRSYKVIPQIGEADRATVAPLLDLKIKTPGGDLVPVSSFTRIESSTAPRVLNRFQQQNAVRVFAGVRPGVTKEEGLSILESAAAATSGPRVIIDHAGESRQIRREGKALTATLGFAIVLIYLVLAAQFQSFRDPLIVLLGSVPLAISSALVFSFLDFTTINIYSQVGLITLVGLIAKNGILIVQFANTLQSRGVAKMEALREASLTRLRPVLMTSAATVFGHLPLVFVTGPGSEARHSIGTVLVSGMAIGTIFTLFVVPVFYSLIAAERSRVPVSASRPERAHPILPGAPAEGWALSSTRALMLTVALLGVTTLALSAQAPMSVATPTSATSAGNVSGRPSPSPLVHASSDTASRDEFWVAIADTTLNRLLEEVRLGSYQLKASAARRDGAGAARLHAGLDLLPAVSARAGYTRRRLPSASFPGAGPGVFPAQDVWESGLDLSWEVDLFGRLRRGLSARAALLGSAGQDLSQMQLEVTSELARSYFGLRGSQGQLAVARRNAENQRRILELARKRHDAGRGTAFDTERAQAQLSFTLAAIPLLEEQVASAQSHIAVLVGRDSEALAAELAGDGGLPELPEELPQLDAAEVLAARPDVLGAHERLSASRASVSAARADYLPRLTLTAGVGYSAAKVNAFGDDGTLNYVVGPVVSWAAFDLGRVKARVEEAEAYEAEARAQYEHVAMLGREDLETASTRYRTARARLTHLRDAAGASERAASLALARYEGGVADFLQVLDAERTLLAAQDQLARGETDVAEAYVALYRARAGRLTLVP